MRSSPFWYAPILLNAFIADHPPALRMRPPPTRSDRFPCLINIKSAINAKFPLKLNTNENPFPPSENAIRRISDSASDTLRLYPDPGATKLKNAIAEYHGLEKNNVFVGNGSDEVLALSFMSFFKNTRPVIFPNITYSFYPVYCALFNIDASCFPLSDEFEINIDLIGMRVGPQQHIEIIYKTLKSCIK